MQIKINVKGVKDWISFLKTVPRGAKGIALRAFSTYVVGDEKHGLRHYPSYKYVSRKSAYGRTWFSAKQRAWWFAAGKPKGNRRTGAIRRGWQIGGSAETRLYIFNNAPGVGWVMGDEQARQPMKVGWRRAWEIIMSNFAGGIRAAQAAVNAWLGSK